MANESSKEKNRIKIIKRASHGLAEVVEDYWDKVLKYTWGEIIKAFLGDRVIGIFGDYKKEGDGWSRIEYLAREIASKKKYRVLTGKGIFYPQKNGDVGFNCFIIKPAPRLVSYKKYSRWLVSLVPSAIILLGPLTSTVEDEEDEASKIGIKTCGVAIIDKISDSVNDCPNLEVIGDRFSFCIDGIGVCRKEKYCPFAEKGLSGGRLDLYCRSENMCLLAVSKKENTLEGLEYIAFI